MALKGQHWTSFIKLPASFRFLGIYLFLAYPNAQAYSEQDLNPFAKSYLNLELARNYPQSFTVDHFESGGLHPIIGYRHNINDSWMMGVGGQFKMLRHTATNDTPVTTSDSLAIFTLYHEGLFALRLDHPTYLLLGPKILYLLPAKSGKLPIERDDKYEIEIGGGFSLAICRILSAKKLLTLRIERWRGTRSMVFHGFEFAFGISIPN